MVACRFSLFIRGDSRDSRACVFDDSEGGLGENWRCAPDAWVRSASRPYFGFRLAFFFVPAFSSDSRLNCVAAFAAEAWALTTETQGGGEEAHRRWPEGHSERGASKAKQRPPIFFELSVTL